MRLLPGPRPRPAISHVIPLRLLQTMNWRRCNCNVCGWSPKVTVGNYVRVLPGLPLSLLVGPAAWPRGLPRRHGNFACNSLLGISNLEFISLELQRFWALLKVHAIELHAKFLVCVSIVTHGLRSFVQGIPRMLRIRIVRGQVGGTPCSAGGPTGFGLLSVVEGVSSRWTVQNSPCLACVLCERYKILPAYAFWAKTAVFSRAGRVLYRDGCVAVLVGRVFSLSIRS